MIEETPALTALAESATKAITGQIWKEYHESKLVETPPHYDNLHQINPDLYHRIWAQCLIITNLAFLLGIHRGLERREEDIANIDRINEKVKVINEFIAQFEEKRE